MKAQRQIVRQWWVVTFGRSRPTLPVVVTMTRFGRHMDAHDSLAAAFKHVTDEITECLGLMNDDTPEITWQYAQRPRGPEPMKITIQIAPRPLKPEQKTHAVSTAKRWALMLVELRGVAYQPDIAKAAGVGAKTLSSFETGKRIGSMKVSQLAKILAVYGVSLSEFFRRCEDAEWVSQPCRRVTIFAE